MLSVDPETYVVALVGLPAAGKSTIAGKLERSYGFNWIRTRDIVRDLGADGTIDSLQRLGASLSAGDGLRRFCEALFSRIVDGKCNVVDAVRPASHWNAIKAKFGAHATLVGVRTPQEIRLSRLAERGSSLSLHERDSHDVEREIPLLLDAAGYVLMNDDCLDYRVELMVAFLFRESLPPPIAVFRHAAALGIDLSGLAALNLSDSPDSDASRISTTINRLTCQ